MSKIVVCKEVAEKEFEDICEAWELDEDDAKDIKKTIVKAICRGRLSYDNEKEVFEYELRKPIVQKDGETVTSFTMRDVEVGSIARHKGSDAEGGLATISNSSKQPIGIVNRLSLKDSSVLGSITAFFA